MLRHQRQQKVNDHIAGVTALSLLITPFLMQASNRWLLLADPEAGTLVSLLQGSCSSVLTSSALQLMLMCTLQ